MAYQAVRSLEDEDDDDDNFPWNGECVLIS